MRRPDFLSKYLYDWELFNVIIGGTSALDSGSFLTPMTSQAEVEKFLDGYGFSPSDPVKKAEIFGYYQEAIQFIKRYFLKEGNSVDGLDIEFPSSLYSISDASELFLMATGHAPERSYEECLWAGTILKVMHTILHADKDLRSNYFQIIQQQIFDRFYKHMSRDNQNHLYLGESGEPDCVPLVDFQTKAKKSRDSIIIKLLHKAENVAEELFDRIGVRFITESKLETLNVVKFLQEKHIVMAHNIKPSRSRNTIVDLEKFKIAHKKTLKLCLRSDLTEERFVHALEREVAACLPGSDDNINKHTKNDYRSIQFTCRQLISYRNPLISKLSELKRDARKQVDNDLAKKILSLDLSHIARDIRFFYPFEVQVVDAESANINQEGEASHKEYKRSQLKSAMKRVFKDLIEYKGLSN